MSDIVRMCLFVALELARCVAALAPSWPAKDRHADQ